jgi:hypothetical protein
MQQLPGRGSAPRTNVGRFRILPYGDHNKSEASAGTTNDWNFRGANRGLLAAIQDGTHQDGTQHLSHCVLQYLQYAACSLVAFGEQ